MRHHGIEVIVCIQTTILMSPLNVIVHSMALFGIVWCFQLVQWFQKKLFQKGRIMCKSIGNISQLETRPLIGWPTRSIGWPARSTNQRPGFQLTFVSNWLMLPIDFHMIRPIEMCGTNAPGWMDAEFGVHPTIVGEEVMRKICFNYGDVSCMFYIHIPVTNCGEYYVYKFPKTPYPYCTLRYCAEQKGNFLPF